MQAIRAILAGAVICTVNIGIAVAQAAAVANTCRDEIAQYCADKSQENSETRTCLEANEDKLSDLCKTALEMTGASQGLRHGQRAQ